MFGKVHLRGPILTFESQFTAKHWAPAAPVLVKPPCTRLLQHPLDLRWQRGSNRHTTGKADWKKQTRNLAATTWPFLESMATNMPVGGFPGELATMRLVRITSDSSQVSGLSTGAASATAGPATSDTLRGDNEDPALISPQVTPKGGDKTMWDDADRGGPALTGAGSGAGRGGAAVGRKRTSLLISYELALP